jgi:hypothetical protein
LQLSSLLRDSLGCLLPVWLRGRTAAMLPGRWRAHSLQSTWSAGGVHGWGIGEGYRAQCRTKLHDTGGKYSGLHTLQD